MGKIRIEARQLGLGSLKNVIAFLCLEFLLLLLFVCIPLFLQFVFNEKTWMLAAKAVFFFMLSVTLPACFLSLRLGVKRYFFQKTQGDEISAREAFYYFRFSRLLKAVKLNISLGILKAVFFAVSFFPCGLFAYLFYYKLESGISFDVAVTIIISFGIFLSVCAFFYFKLVRLMFLAKYIFIKHEDFGVKECISQSFMIMRKNTGRLFHLRIGFILWFGLCIFVFPFAYVFGYYEQSLAVLASQLISQLKNEEV